MFDKTLKKTFFVDRCFIFKNKIVVGCLTTFFAQKKNEIENITTNCINL